MLSTLSWEHFLLAFLGSLCFEIFKIYELKQKKSLEDLKDILSSYLFYLVIILTSLASGIVICIFTASAGCTALSLFTIFVLGAMAKPIFIKALETYSAKMGLKHDTIQIPQEPDSTAPPKADRRHAITLPQAARPKKSVLIKKRKITLSDIYG